MAANIITALIVAVAFVAALVRIILKHKKGGGCCGCSGDCCGCKKD
ncbi:FeoB-associated Cys-rich membrane protein [Treponema sp.]